MKFARGFAFFAAAVLAPIFLHIGSASSAPVESPWQLDRINQNALPLDGNLSVGTLTGAGIDIYLVDSGVRFSHEQLNGRAIPGIDVLTSKEKSVVSPPASDCDGHGTHVAALAAGSTVGVATQARVISARVLDCGGDGDVADVVTTLRWIRANHRAGILSVVNLSLGVDMGDDGQALSAEVQKVIDDGILVTVAAGNGDGSAVPFDACQTSPSNVPGALVVGATGITDAAAYYSNYGPCVDIYAPGGDRTKSVTSAWFDADTSYRTDVGTSMATPLVSGYAALLAQQQPGLCADDVSNAIVSRATLNVITNLQPTSPNKMLFLDTAPVAPSTPGQPSHVIVTTDGPALVASWDYPCDGGSPITSTELKLFSGTKLVRTVTAAPGTSLVRFKNLRLGRQYKVMITPSNGLGVGESTPKLTTVATRSLRSGQTLSLASLGHISGNLPLKWTVTGASRNICRTVSGGRLRLLRRGICAVELRSIAGQTPVTRKLRIG